MKPSIVRVTSNADYARLHALLVEYEAYLPPALRLGVVPGAHELSSMYAEPGAAFLAVAGAAAIGCVAVRQLDRDTAALLRLYVRGERRGLGAGRALVGAVLAFARERDYARVVLDTHRSMLPEAYALYASLGFSECPPHPAGDPACTTFMALAL